MKNLLTIMIVTTLNLLVGCGGDTSPPPPPLTPADYGLLNSIEILPDTTNRQLFVSDAITYSVRGIHELGTVDYTTSSTITMDSPNVASLTGTTLTLNSPASSVTVTASYNGYQANGTFSIWDITGITLLTDTITLAPTSAFTLSQLISFNISNASTTQLKPYIRGYNDQPLVTFTSNDVTVVTVIDPQFGHLQPQGSGSTTVNICSVENPAICALPYTVIVQ